VVIWQMPHFFAIAIYRYKDYAAASIPVLPIQRGMYTTKVHMVLYIVAFIFIALALTALGYTGYFYGVITALLSLIWLGMCIRGFNTSNDTLWARNMFVYSLVVIMGISLAIPLDVVA